MAYRRPDMALAARSRARSYSGLLALLVILLAFALRAYHLDFQSLWSDEGISLLRSSQPLGQMLQLMPVEHVPGYFVLLHFWLPLAGTGDFALRYPSLWPSVLAVALAYRLAVDLGSRRSGLLAGLLLATNAFQVWYAQDARMYSWLLATALGSTWFLFRLLPGAPGEKRPRAGTVVAFAGYVLCTAATIYLHHYGFMVPLAQALFVVGWLIYTRSWLGGARWAVAGLAVIVLYLPWVPRFLGIFGFPGWRQPLDPWGLPWRYFAAYAVGDPMPTPWHTWLPWLYLVLGVFGLVLWWRRSRMGALLLLTIALVPVAAAVALALRRPDFHERYTIFVSAPLMMLAAGTWMLLPSPRAGRAVATVPGGAAEIVPGDQPIVALAANVLAGLVLAGLLAANGLALYRLYTDPSVQKADYKAAIQRIEQWAQPGDVILLDGPDPQQIFLHYYTGRTPWYDLRPLLNMPDASVDAAMQQTVQGARRAWVLRHYHDEGPVEAWLARHGWPATQSYYGGLFFYLYGLPELGETLQPAERTFGPALRLAGAGLAGTTGTPPAVHAGDLLGLTTEWEVLQTPPPLKFSLRLLDSSGRRWAAEDYVPQAGFAPTEAWQPGQRVVDRHAVWLPADLPPGSYAVDLVVYNPATGQPLDSGEQGPIAQVEILPAAQAPDPVALTIPHPLGRALNGDLALLGWDITPQRLNAGQGADLTLWWQATAQPAAPYQVLVELTRGPEEFLARKLYPLSSFAATSWQPGQILRAHYPLELNPAAPSGEYRLALTLAGLDGQPVGSPLTAGFVAFAARPRRYTLPPMDRTVDASIGGAIDLRGYDLRPPRDIPGELKLTLYWQAGAPATAPYKVFVHLMADDGRIVAQSDAFPAGGSAPTETWLAKEVIADQHTLAVAAPGHYRLLAGLYYPGTGLRLEAHDRSGQAFPDNAVLLGEIDVP